MINTFLRVIGFTAATLAIAMNAAWAEDDSSLDFGAGSTATEAMYGQEDIQLAREYLRALGAPASGAMVDQILTADPDMNFLDQVELSGDNPRIISDGTGTAKFEVVGQSVIRDSIKASVYAHSNADPDGTGAEGLLAYSTGSGLFQSSSGGLFQIRDGETYASAATTGLVFIIPYTDGLVGSTSAPAPDGTIGVHTGVRGAAHVTLLDGETNPDILISYGVHGTNSGGIPVATDTKKTQHYGVYAENTSNKDTKGYALYATGTIDAEQVFISDLEIDEHVAAIENKSVDMTNVLALYMSNKRQDQLDAYDNFVTFYARNAANSADEAVGAIEGTPGGITLDTTSGDYAEWLEQENPNESLQAADIVGISNGKISRNTLGAQNFKIISTAPAVSGNSPGQSESRRANWKRVAFIGQVPARVKGKVASGDYILPSNDNDGTGIAISADDMTPANYRMLVGRAWQSSSDEGVKLVKVAVGLAANDAYTYMQKQDQRIASLESRLSDKMAQLERLAGQMEMLTQKVAYIQSTNMLAAAKK